MRQYVNAYAPVNHSALLCPIREAAKAWAVLTEAGSTATQEEKDAAQSVYRAAKRAAGIDEVWTPAKQSIFGAPHAPKPQAALNTEAGRTEAKKARNQRYGRQTDERRRQETKANQAKAEKPRPALGTEAERADAKRAQDRVYGAARRARAKAAAG